MLTNGMAITAKGMMASIDMNDNVAHNMANINTAGYRRSNVMFKNIYDATVEQTRTSSQDSYSRPLGKISMGPETQKVIYEFSQGTLARTGRALDIAIEGDGFFKLRDKDGKISYTRSGDFCINNKNMLVTKDGENVLDPLSKPIKIDITENGVKTLNNIVIGERGEIELITDDQQRTRLQSIGIFDSFLQNKNLLDANLPKKSLDLITANPPYIDKKDMPTLMSEVRDFEPKMALDGGKDGLKIYKKLFNDIYNISIFEQDLPQRKYENEEKTLFPFILIEIEKGKFAPAYSDEKSTCSINIVIGTNREDATQPEAIEVLNKIALFLCFVKQKC